jgi:hypothetical protein
MTQLTDVVKLSLKEKTKGVAIRTGTTPPDTPLVASSFMPYIKPRTTQTNPIKEVIETPFDRSSLRSYSRTISIVSLSLCFSTLYRNFPVSLRPRSSSIKPIASLCILFNRRLIKIPLRSSPVMPSGKAFPCRTRTEGSVVEDDIAKKAMVMIGVIVERRFPSFPSSSTLATYCL